LAQGYQFVSVDQLWRDQDQSHQET
jgi:hypothetical protein